MVLRDPEPADAEAFVRAFAEDPALGEALGAETEPTVAEIAERIGSETARRDRGERIHFTLVEPASDAFAGDLTLHRFRWEHHRAEVGFFLVPRARGRGIATEALRLVTRWAFSALGLARIGLETLDDNLATQALAERAGFSREGVLRAYTCEFGRQRDNVVFSLLSGDLPA